MLSSQGYRELTTPGTLNDGTPLRYAKGLSVFEQGGRRVLAHGGGIPGFLSQVTYYPEEDLSVIVLVNTAGPPGPGAIANDIVQLLLVDRPTPPAKVYSGNMEHLKGTYRGPGRGGEFVVTIDTEAGNLTAAMGEAEPTALSFVDGLTFRLGNTTFTFMMESEVVDRLQVDQISGLYVLRPDPL